MSGMNVGAAASKPLPSFLAAAAAVSALRVFVRCHENVRFILARLLAGAGGAAAVRAAGAAETAASFCTVGGLSVDAEASSSFFGARLKERLRRRVLSFVPPEAEVDGAGAGTGSGTPAAGAPTSTVFFCFWKERRRLMVFMAS